MQQQEYYLRWCLGSDIRCSPMAKKPVGTTLVPETNIDSANIDQAPTELNSADIKAMITDGDKAMANGDLKEAKANYDEASNSAERLLNLYKDLSDAFRGLDARIPREMNSKGQEMLELLAEANLQLAALFRRQNQPEMAVPILVDVIKQMSPTRPEGIKAYQSLRELGFAETEYKEGRSHAAVQQEAN